MSKLQPYQIKQALQDWSAIRRAGLEDESRETLAGLVREPVCPDPDEVLGMSALAGDVARLLNLDRRTVLDIPERALLPSRTRTTLELLRDFAEQADGRCNRHGRTENTQPWTAICCWVAEVPYESARPTHRRLRSRSLAQT